MAAIQDSDISIDPTTGNIRWTGAATTNKHTVLEFMQWLMDKADDDTAVGNDILDITVETPYDRSTDQIVTLNSPFNIDDTFATHLYDGSVSQVDSNGHDTLYSGLRLIGPVESGTEYMILQNGKVLPAFWGTGINNEDAPSLVFSRHLVKSKVSGSEIDGQQITVLARELGDQFRRFPVTLGTGNSVAAIGNGADIFNDLTVNNEATIAGWTDILNTEGYQLIDIDNDAADEEYYSQWVKDTRTVNNVYERSKWITQRSHTADVTTPTQTGTDHVVDNGTTIQGIAQSFIPPSGVGYDEMLTEVRFQIKINAGTPTGLLYCELYDSDDGGVGTALPTGAVLARSENVLASAITSTYEEIIFRFNRFNPSTGAAQYDTLDLGNAEYFISIRHDDGDHNSFAVDGAAVAGDASMGSATYDGTSWGAASTSDLQLEVKSSPPIHGVPGEIFQGINVEVAYDAEGGTGAAENDIACWGSKITYGSLSGNFIEGEELVIKDNGTQTILSGGHVLFDDNVDTLIVSLDTLSAGIVSTDDIVGLVSGATAEVSAIADGDKGGGTGIVLALDDNGTAGEVYLQVLSGVNPVEDSVIYSETDDANTVTATATINTRTVNPEFLGTSTGSNIIGAYGIGFDKDDVGSSDLLRALDNSTYQPPNNVAFTVSAIISGDRVLVGPRTGSLLDRGQWVLAATGTLSATNETSVVLASGTDTVPWTSPDDINWPATGTASDVSSLRIELDSGIYRRVDYASHDSSDTFTLAATDFSTDNAAGGNDVFMAFIDVATTGTSESFSGVHTAGNDRTLFVRVRDGGGTPIKTFESVTAQFLSTPQTIAATRTDDY